MSDKREKKWNYIRLNRHESKVIKKKTLEDYSS